MYFQVRKPRRAFLETNEFQLVSPSCLFGFLYRAPLLCLLFSFSSSQREARGQRRPSYSPRTLDSFYLSTYFLPPSLSSFDNEGVGTGGGPVALVEHDSSEK